MSSSPRVRLISLALGITFSIVWCLAFFGAVLSGERTFAFRDTGHYYYRLFAWANDEFDAGRIPLWNPHENGGVPQIADASSSVFYPGKLLFFIPGLDYTLLFNAYIVLHYVLAAVGIMLLGRRWQWTPLALAVSVVAYVSSGALLSQSCNVVFLVGAAWLPWACLALSLLRQRPWMGAMGLAAVLSMMVLGGDPQMAYHVVLIGLVMIIFDRRGVQPTRGWTPVETFETYRSPYRQRGWSSNFMEQLSKRLDRRLLYLSGAAVCAIALSAIQVLPSAVWSRDSSRSLYTRPRSIYEAAAIVSSLGQQRDAEVESANKWYEASQGLLGEPEVGTHHDHIYQFSVPPWTLPELVWPNFGGRIFPTHRRWIDEVGSAERVWNPSIYLGFLPCLLALSVWSLRGKSSRQRVLSWMLLLSLLASLGWYGLGWLLREVVWMTSGAPPNSIQMGSPTGGIYWMLVTFLPWYAQFRYPAKWLVVTAFAVAMLAGLGVTRVSEGRGSGSIRRLQRFALVGGGLTAVVLIASFVAQNWLMTSWFDRPADRLFGPFQAAESLADARWSLVQTLISLAVGGALLLGWRRAQRPWVQLSLGVALVVMIGMDYWIANRWVIATASKEAWENYPDELLATLPGQTSIATNSADQSSPPLTRVYRAGLYDWLPESFQASSSQQRLEEIVRWDTATLFPKHHLPIPVTLVESYGSIAAADQEVLLQVGREHSNVSIDSGSPELAPELLRLLGTEWVIAPQPLYSAQSGWLDQGELHQVGQASLERCATTASRVWLVNHVEKIQTPRRHSFRDLHEATTEAYLTADGWRNPTEFATVYRTDAKRLLGLQEDAITTSSPRIVGYSSQTMQIEVETEGTMLLVVNEYYRPGWKARIQPQNPDTDDREWVEPVVRVNQVMRGVVVPEGDYVVELFYDPAEFRWGVWISLFSWSSLALALVGTLIGTRVKGMRDEHRRLSGRSRRSRSDS